MKETQQPKGIYVCKFRGVGDDEYEHQPNDVWIRDDGFVRWIYSGMVFLVPKENIIFLSRKVE